LNVHILVNGSTRELDVPAGTTLLAALRDDLNLTGTHYGCGHGICGACFVLVDGEAQPACSLLVEDVAQRSITTIEGVADDGALHPVQQAFLDEDAMQCGYCTPGMIVSAVALLGSNSHPSDVDIRAALSPHLCRCGIYGRAVRAVRRAASKR
jgi:aerobic-type carbon monoxide dehydrogenase small subunit (CoxS/CutS family)